MRFATLVFVLLAGCATPGAELTEATGSWDGATYDEVVLRWGAPARGVRAKPRSHRCFVSIPSCSSSFVCSGRS